MADLTEEEKEILYRAHEIKERIRAEQLEAGEITLEEARNMDLEETLSAKTPPRSTREEELRYENGEETAEENEQEENDYGEVAESFENPDESRAPERSEEPIPSISRSVSREKKQKKDPETSDLRETKKQKRSSADMAEKRREKRMKKEVRKEEQKRRKVQKKKRHGFFGILLRVLLSLVLIAALLLTVSYALIRTQISKTNYTPYETAYTRAADVVTEAGVTNILLIGTDNRVADDSSRSDAMIIVSINRKKAKIVMTSILRDSYVTIPGYGQNRLNHAYQMGGAALLIETIEENFKIGIDYYVQVDFYDFIDVVDAFGGVEINVTAEEFNYVNGYVSEINAYEGRNSTDFFLAEPGLQTLNGHQALGYSRIRYIGTDFERTTRQRTVLNALIEKVKKNPLKLIDACNAVLPDLTTNIDDNEMTLLLLQCPLFAFYQINQFRVPTGESDGTWYNTYMENGQEVLGIDFIQTNELLRSAIYD